MIRGIDHLVIASDDPDAAADALETAVGIAFTGGGRHESFGTRNRLAFLADGSYVELIGIVDPELVARSPVGAASMRILVTQGSGLATWAALVDDIEAAVDSLNGAGAAYGSPTHGSRRRDDGELVEWWTAFPDAPLNATRPFLIQHAMTGAEWGPVALEERASFIHPLGSPVRLSGITLAVDDPPAASAELAHALGIEGHAVPDFAVLAVGPHEVRLRPRGEMPVAAAVTLGADVETPVSADLLGLAFGVDVVEAPLREPNPA